MTNDECQMTEFRPFVISHSEIRHFSLALYASHLIPAFPMDWPVATVLLGTLGTLAVAILKWMPRREGERSSTIANGRVYARAVDLAEIRARLVSLEQAHHVLRAELRADMKELQQIIRETMVK
jgi:hypothetical protein